MNELNDLLDLSYYTGCRFDYVQAGGGNTSVKTENGEMLIKASGYLLSEMDKEKGYSIVDNKKVLEILQVLKVKSDFSKRELDTLAGKMLQELILSGERPSIETFLHSLLYKYTAHVHSIAINIHSSKSGWKEKLALISSEALFVDYKTPGIELALEMLKEIDEYTLKFNRLPKIIFLQNHGLIISSDQYSEVLSLMEEVTLKAEKLAGVNFDRYRRANYIVDQIKSKLNEQYVAYLTEDRYISSILESNEELFLKGPFCPDGLVYCGYEAVTLNAENDFSEVLDYKNKYNELPKVVILEKEVYLIEKSLKKAKLVEDVLKNNLMILESQADQVEYLTEIELAYLGNWEAEKYRQNK